MLYLRQGERGLGHENVIIGFLPEPELGVSYSQNLLLVNNFRRI